MNFLIWHISITDENGCKTRNQKYYPNADMRTNILHIPTHTHNPSLPPQSTISIPPSSLKSPHPFTNNPTTHPTHRKYHFLSQNLYIRLQAPSQPMDIMLIWSVSMALFCAAIRRNSVLLLKFPFLSHVRVFSCEKLLISRLKRP